MMQSHTRQMNTMIANALLVISLSAIGDSSHFLNESPTTIITDIGDTFTQQSGFGNVTKSTNASNLPPLSPLGPFDRYIEQLPLFGYPGPLFYAVHSLGLISLSVSVLVGIVLILYLFFWSRQNSRCEEAPQTVSTNITTGAHSSSSHPQTGAGSTKKSNITDRLIIYLAVIDLGMGISHMLDHAYVVHTKSLPPDAICSAFAFILQTFSFSQWVIVAYTAVNACSMIVFSKKIQLGRMDWKLILFAFFVPLLIAAVALRLGFLGQNGAWCIYDLRTRAGLIFAQALAILQLIDFGVVSTSYGAILYKIRRSAATQRDEKADRYRNSARIMIIFVVVFIFQWWSPALFNFWSFFGNPPDAIFIIVVIFTNLGGVYNGIAYTVIRRRFTQVAAQKSA